MKIVPVRVTNEMYARLVNASRDNRRSLGHEAACRLGQTLSAVARARAAKTAIMAASFADAQAFARCHGWKRDRWFYAYSVESCTGRYVKDIVITGNYSARRSHGAIVRELHGGILAAQAQHRAAAELGE